MHLFQAISQSDFIKFAYNELKRGALWANISRSFEKLISAIVDIMLAILVVLVLVVMAEAIYKIITYVIPLTKVSDLSF